MWRVPRNPALPDPVLPNLVDLMPVDLTPGVWGA